MEASTLKVSADDITEPSAVARDAGVNFGVKQITESLSSGRHSSIRATALGSVLSASAFVDSLNGGSNASRSSEASLVHVHLLDRENHSHRARTMVQGCGNKGRTLS